MGLDMYLTGIEHLATDWKNPEKNLMRDGFKLEEYRLELGYWRKHPNLHGFIVTTFAGGEDTCQEIELMPNDLRAILAATKKKSMPKTTGFFFGESRPEDDAQTLEIITKALEWLEAKKDGVYKSVIYRASW